MPTYDYVCESCGNRFEEWQKITDDPTKICPVCGGPVHRVIYPVGLVFKGSGFYKTDNRATPAAESSATSATTTATESKDTTTKGGESGAATKGGDATPTGAAAKSE